MLRYAILPYVLNSLFPRVTGEYFSNLCFEKKISMEGNSLAVEQLILFVYNGAPARLYTSIYKSLGLKDKQFKGIRYLWFHCISKI